MAGGRVALRLLAAARLRIAGLAVICACLLRAGQAATQALQNTNIALGFDELTGLQ